MRKVDVIIERGNDGLYSAYMDSDKFDFGLNGQGETVDEALKEFDAVYEDMKALYLDEGKDMPSIEFEFRYDVPSFLDYYANVFSKPALEKITGINQKQFFHYLAGKNPSKTTILKIQEGLHKLGRELSQVHFID
jgi:predicted RNase H-like HicB family nuclease